MKYKTVKDILYDVFTEDEVLIEGIGGFFDTTDRIRDRRPRPNGVSKEDFDRLYNNCDASLIPTIEKEEEFSRLAREFMWAHPKSDIYEGATELEECAITFLY